MYNVYQGKHFRNTTTDFGSNGFAISQANPPFLYKFVDSSVIFPWNLGYAAENQLLPGNPMGAVVVLVTALISSLDTHGAPCTYDDNLFLGGPTYSPWTIQRAGGSESTLG